VLHKAFNFASLFLNFDIENSLSLLQNIVLSDFWAISCGTEWQK